MILALDIPVVVGAALFCWVWSSQLTTPVLSGIQRWLRSGWRRPLISCPWCSGFWLAAAFTLVLHSQMAWLDPVGTPLVVLASTGFVGLLGGFTPGILDEGE